MHDHPLSHTCTSRVVRIGAGPSPVISPPRTRIDSSIPTRSSRDRSHAIRVYILSCRFRGGDSNSVGAQSPAASRTNLEARCVGKQKRTGRTLTVCMPYYGAAAQGSAALAKCKWTVGDEWCQVPRSTVGIYIADHDSSQSAQRPRDSVCSSKPNGSWTYACKNYVDRRRRQCWRRVYASISIAR
jgi:hypothetical protein